MRYVRTKDMIQFHRLSINSTSYPQEYNDSHAYHSTYIHLMAIYSTDPSKR